MIKIGCITDDFKTADRAYDELINSGYNPQLVIDLDNEVIKDNVDSIVIGLNTRYLHKDEAVAISKKALAYLKSHNSEFYYLMYPATLELSDDGNVGYVLDSFMSDLKCQYTTIALADLKENITVKEGLIYVDSVEIVNTQLNQEAKYKKETSDIKLLLSPQIKIPSFNIYTKDLMDDQIFDKLKIFKRFHNRFYLIFDLENIEHIKQVIKLTKGLNFYSGSISLFSELINSIKDN